MLPAVCLPRPTSEMEADNQLCPNCQKELEVAVELQGCEEWKTVMQDQRKEELKRVIEEKKKRLEQLLSEVQRTKDSLAELVEKKQTLSEACSKVLATKTRLQLSRLAYDSWKRTLRQELEELREVEKRNKRREDRLKHVRQKNFHKKEEEARSECLKVKVHASRLSLELQEMRKRFIMEAHRLVFPIEVVALSERDAGEEDYLQMSEINLEESMDVDEGWVLSGLHTHPTPNMRIVSASIPSNGDYSAHIKAAAQRRRLYAEAAQQGGGGASIVDVSAASSCHPSDDPYLMVPAALGYTAQLVLLVSQVLDQPLPYPLTRHLAISEYNNPNQKKRVFVNSVARLDDNIMYLCFSQNVPLSALTPGHTLQNLLALVTHTHLGRSGAFECFPELTRYRGRTGKPLPSSLSHDPDDSEPPNLLYTADQSISSHHGNESDSDEEESDNETAEEDTPTNYQDTPEGFDWECLDPSEMEIELFEEEQQRMRSSSLGQGESPSHYDVMAQRDRLRRLDYDSTYLDYMSGNIRSLNESSSVQLSARDSIRLLSSIDEIGAEKQTATPTEDGTEKSVTTETGGGGLFGTLSSLWTSTFGGGGSAS